MRHNTNVLTSGIQAAAEKRTKAQELRDESIKLRDESRLEMTKAINVAANSLEERETGSPWHFWGESKPRVVAADACLKWDIRGTWDIRYSLEDADRDKFSQLVDRRHEAGQKLAELMDECRDLDTKIYNMTPADKKHYLFRVDHEKLRKVQKRGY